MLDTNQKKRTWTCFLCHNEYPNTLLYCPKCNIARLHSNNLYESAQEKMNKKKAQKMKRFEDFKKWKKKMKKNNTFK